MNLFYIILKNYVYVSFQVNATILFELYNESKKETYA